MPFTEYIAVTKQICDRLGENTDGVHCSEFYQKLKDLLQDYKNRHASHPNITKEEREVIQTLKEDNTQVVLTTDKGVAMVVMDKSSYIDKCMTLLQDTNVYKPCRDLTGQIHRHVQVVLHRLKGNIGKNINGCNYTTTNCSLQVTPTHQQDSMVYPKFIRQIAHYAPLFQLVGHLHTTWPNI